MSGGGEAREPDFNRSHPAGSASEGRPIDAADRLRLHERSAQADIASPLPRIDSPGESARNPVAAMLRSNRPEQVDGVVAGTVPNGKPRRRQGLPERVNPPLGLR